MDKVNILVVDDRPEGILAVQAVLSTADYRIVTANSGGEALKRLLADDFAVILLDVQMPMMNGFETAAVMKTREKSKDIPIIFMSAINQDEQYVYQGYEVGAVDYLLKPFDPYILRSKVAIFVDIFRKKRLIKEQAQRLYESESKAHAVAMDQKEVEGLRRYQYLADSIPQIVFRLMPDGAYEYFNKVWFEYTGLTLHGTTGTNWKNVIHPEDLDVLMTLFKDEESDHGREGECRILNKNGVFRWHLIRIQPESYLTPLEISSWLGTATDIEDRKKTEDTQRFLAEAGELLVGSLDYHLTLMNVSNLAIPFIADWCSFLILKENDNEDDLVINHRDPKQIGMIKKLHNDFLYTNKSDFGVNKVIESKKTKIYQNLGYEMQMRTSGAGKETAFINELGGTSLMMIPLMTKGEVCGVMTFGASESGRKYSKDLVSVGEELGRRVALAYENAKLYKLSQKAIEIRNDFLSIASHELNTPITSLKLQLQMVKKTLSMSNGGDLPIDRFTKSIDSSVKQVDRLINLVQILLDVSRIQSGKLTFAFEKVDVIDLISEVAERYKEIMQNSDCSLALEIPEKMTAIWDKTRIEQVVINLLTNAIKYAPGKMKLSAREENGIIAISVQDFGRGIPANKMGTIFDRFERATANESVSGLGLGLFIVKQIVEGHHGKIEVNSKEDEGSCFTILLPKDVTQLKPKSDNQPTENPFH